MGLGNTFIGITLILSHIMLVFGELVPKRIALRYPEKFAMIAVIPINIFSKLIKPFIWFLSVSTNAILAIFGVKSEGEENKITIEEITSLLKQDLNSELLIPEKEKC